jgi:prophage lambdaSa04, minor structural protein
MANFSKTTSNGYVRLVFQVTEASTSIPYNTSEVVYHLMLERGSTWAYDLNDESLAEAEINGQKVISKYVSFDLRDKEWVSLGKGSVTIPHNEDGSKSISIRARLTNVSNLGDIGWFSGTLNLSTIPRASTIRSVSATELGKLVTVEIEKKVSEFRHKVLWKVNDSGWNDLGTGHDTSVQFTIPIDYANRITNSDTGQIDVCVRTFRGDEQIGYDEFKRGIPIKVPASIVPTLEDVTITERTARLAEFIPTGNYVKGKSLMRVEAINAAGSHGSTIISTELTVDNLVVRASTGDFPANKAGNLEVTAKITDSRGRTATKSKTIKVWDYYAPKIIAFLANRTGNGTNKTIIATVAANVSPLVIDGVNRNPYTLKIQYSAKKANRWIDAVNLTNESTEKINRQIDCGAFYELSKAYNVRLVIQDKLSDLVDSVLLVRSSRVLWAWGDNRAAVGGFPELDGHFESHLPVAFHSSLNVEDGIMSNGKPIQEFSLTSKDGKSNKFTGDLNNLKTAGGYHAFGVQNNPSGTNNYGYVNVITHSSDSSHCVQFYVPFNSDQFYMRRCDSNRWSEWIRVVTTSANTDWKTANLQSGWQHRTEYEQVQYYKSVDGIVRFRGIATGGNIDKETVVFQLPQDFRPEKQVFTFGMNDDFKPVAICIYNTGSVVIKDNADKKWLGLHSVSFKI